MSTLLRNLYISNYSDTYGIVIYEHMQTYEHVHIEKSENMAEKCFLGGESHFPFLFSHLHSVVSHNIFSVIQQMYTVGYLLDERTALSHYRLHQEV